MRSYGEWKTGTIANGAATTGEIDLGQDYEFLDIILPALTACTLKVTVAKVTGGTFQDLGSGVVVPPSGTTTGGYSDVWRLGGWQFIKIVTSANQSAARSIVVRGGRD